MNIYSKSARSFQNYSYAMENYTYNEMPIFISPSKIDYMSVIKIEQAAKLNESIEFWKSKKNNRKPDFAGLLISTIPFVWIVFVILILFSILNYIAHKIKIHKRLKKAHYLRLIEDMVVLENLDQIEKLKNSREFYETLHKNAKLNKNIDMSIFSNEKFDQKIKHDTRDNKILNDTINNMNNMNIKEVMV